MCLDRGNCERVFGEIRVLRALCKEVSRESNKMMNKVMDGVEDKIEAIKMINKYTLDTAKIGGGITKLIWKLCPDCRGIFYGKD